MKVKRKLDFGDPKPAAKPYQPQTANPSITKEQSVTVTIPANCKAAHNRPVRFFNDWARCARIFYWADGTKSEITEEQFVDAPRNSCVFCGGPLHPLAFSLQSILSTPSHIAMVDY